MKLLGHALKLHEWAFDKRLRHWYHCCHVEAWKDDEKYRVKNSKLYFVSVDKAFAWLQGKWFVMHWGFSQGDYGVYEVCKMVLKVSFQNLFSWGWFPSGSSVKSIIVRHYNGCIDRTFTYWQNILIQVIKCSRSGTRSDID